MVQPPITGSLARASGSSAGTSSASVVTFLSARSFGRVGDQRPGSQVGDAETLTRSKISPRLTDERVLALADEQLRAGGAARDVDVVDVLLGVGRVVGDRLDADVVDRLVERRRCRPRRCVTAPRVPVRRSPRTTSTRDRSPLTLSAAAFGGRDLARLDQRDRRRSCRRSCSADALQLVLEAELEGDVFLARRRCCRCGSRTARSGPA